MVRSQTKVTAKLIDAATKLKVIGRAGVGVDNVDVDAATRRGMIVMNTPGGNTISTAEHTFSLLMSLARKIPQAHASMKAGKWDRKSFEGVGALRQDARRSSAWAASGPEVARRAMAFGMRVLAYDPYLSASRARTPAGGAGREPGRYSAAGGFHHDAHAGDAGDAPHAQCGAPGEGKKGVRIINCARGGLVDEAALLDALKSGQVGGAALDVYEKEPPPADFPLRELPNVVLTPHLGASTAEAQESVGIEIAQAIRADAAARRNPQRGEHADHRREDPRDHRAVSRRWAKSWGGSCRKSRRSDASG